MTSLLFKAPSLGNVAKTNASIVSSYLEGETCNVKVQGLAVSAEFMGVVFWIEHAYFKPGINTSQPAGSKV